MMARHVSEWCLVAALAVIAAGFGLDQAVAGPPDVEEGVQVLTRGPVHEAFAETVTFDPEPGLVVTKAPPEPIEELPPAQRPAGANVEWIPGYWAWDDERNDFLWVSGVWRDLPPGREWVPGYWGRTAQGSQWTSGYWADAQASEIEYLPDPPETVEVGPNIAAPSADEGWIPGSWVWHQGRYAWRPGYWMAVQQDWDWVPAHYVWAPRGYVFVDGYWDYSVGRRGVLFAPVYFDAGVYQRSGFSYSPATVIEPAVFSNHLFLRPRYSHYYFGDYYAPSYHDAGFYAAFSFSSDRQGYDPIYAHERWEHRQDSEWGHHVEADFRNRRDHEDARPPHTLAAQLSFGASEAKSRDRSLVVATSLGQLVGNTDARLRFQPVDQNERQRLAQRGKEVQTFREERRKLETTAADAPAEKPAPERGPARVTVRRSPIVAKPAAELGQDRTPPRRPEPPTPDPKVEPKPKKAKEKREHR
jgi:hypothetical protein